MTDQPTHEIPPARPAEPVAAPPSVTPPPSPAMPPPSPVKRTVWPTVIGIISIVVASLWILGGACGTIGSLLGSTLAPQFDSFAPGAMTITPPLPTSAPATGRPTAPAAGTTESFGDVMRTAYLWQSINSLLSLAVAILLLIAGIHLLRRRRSARMLHLIYVGLETVSVVVGCVITWHVQEMTMGSFTRAAMDNGDAPVQLTQFMGSCMQVARVGGILWQIVIGMAYPVFLLVWFLRPAARREVEGWNAAR